MYISLAQQFQVFFGAIILGAVFGVLYDIFRIIRLMFFKSPVAVFVEDILFWLLVTIITFFFTILFNNGELRLSLIICETLGFLIYYFTLGRLVFKCFSAFFGAISKIFSEMHKKLRKIFKKRDKNVKKPLQIEEEV